MRPYLPGTQRNPTSCRPLAALPLQLAIMVSHRSLFYAYLVCLCSFEIQRWKSDHPSTERFLLVVFFFIRRLLRRNFGDAAAAQSLSAFHRCSMGFMRCRLCCMTTLLWTRAIAPSSNAAAHLLSAFGGTAVVRPFSSYDIPPRSRSVDSAVCFCSTLAGSASSSSHHLSLHWCSLSFASMLKTERSALLPIAHPVAVAPRDDSGAASSSVGARMFAASLHALQWSQPAASSDNAASSRGSAAQPSYGASGGVFILYPRRWLMLFLFSLLSASNSQEWLTYAPLSSLFAVWYGVSPLAIAALAMVFLIVYALGAFVVAAQWTASGRGLREGLLLAAALNVIGATLKLLPWPFLAPSSPSVGGYAFALWGSFFCSCAQLFLLAAPVLLAQEWFGSHERVVATALGAAANALGGAVAFGLVPLVLGSEIENTENMSIEQVRALPLQRYLLAQLVLVILAAVAIHRWFEERPPSPPSFAAAASAAGATSYGTILRELRVEDQTEGSVSLPTSPLIGVGLASSVSPPASNASASSSSFGGAKLPPPDFLHLLSLLSSLWRSDPSFRLVLLAFALLDGFLYALLTLLSTLLISTEAEDSATESRFSAGLVSRGGVGAIVCGAVASTLAALVVGGAEGRRMEWKRHKKLLVGTALTVASADMALFALLPKLTHANESAHIHSERQVGQSQRRRVCPVRSFRFCFFFFCSSTSNVLFIVLCILGASLSAPLAVLLDLSVELSFPSPASLVSQLLLVSGAVAGVLLTALLSLLSGWSPLLGGLVCACLLGTMAQQWRGYEGTERRSESEDAMGKQAEMQLGFTPAHAASAPAASSQSSAVHAGKPIASSASVATAHDLL